MRNVNVQTESHNTELDSSDGHSARQSHIGFRKFGRMDQPIEIEPKDEFAIVQLGSQQFKVTPDDVILCEKVEGVLVFFQNNNIYNVLSRIAN